LCLFGLVLTWQSLAQAPRLLGQRLSRPSPPVLLTWTLAPRGKSQICRSFTLIWITQATTLQTKRDKLAKDRATMSQDQISRAEKDLRDGERDLARRQAEIQDDFNARRNEEMSKLQRTLIDEVRNFARIQNFDLVLTADGVIYAGTALDITPGVLQQLNGRNPSAAPRPAAPAPAPAAAPAPAPKTGTR
jgi:outer membrane protein